ncbi:hypothetical protein HYALB_00004113 [Hymenoscyphus albidus]|uniref:Carboxylic ester hydrolase n=1 Tax=Hymenoscyphus albidus TaxID=595503 RepID=A0A9N9M3T5_9HELO|nr:hypothetical protein HYALB_00004113 [Hymenoscyphus albidus]
MKIELSLAAAALTQGISASACPLDTTTQATSEATFQQKCEALTSNLKIDQAEVTLSTYVPANSTVQFPNADPTCGRTSQRVTESVCRVALTYHTSNASQVSIETWLPEKWTGRFLSTGNGGLGGCIQYEDINYATSLGFAAVGTNNGHDGMTGESFLNHPDVIEDFAYRALHTGVVVGKEISNTFYEKPLSKSYYLGCSTGGRQGMKEAQTFPEDFDGIIAGAPAMSFNNLTSWSSNFLIITGAPGSPTFIPLDFWSTIHQDVLAQCDMLDGVADGILEQPDLCPYDPSGLVCTERQNSSSCLTPTQVETVKKIYSPLIDPLDGSLVYPRMNPGNEILEAPFTYYTGARFGAADWFEYAILNDSNWDPATLTPADWRLSSTLNLFNIETFNGDLSALQNRGSKLLHYHGTADGVISSENSPRYYQHVVDTMGKSPAELDDFYRYFPISGMAHCGGGPGATKIGNGARQSNSLDPAENVLMAMVQWVEEGIAPETVTGVQTSADGQVTAKRRHCKWPARTTYNGVGDSNNPDSWSCV